MPISRLHNFKPSPASFDGKNVNLCPKKKADFQTSRTCQAHNMLLSSGWAWGPSPAHQEWYSPNPPPHRPGPGSPLSPPLGAPWRSREGGWTARRSTWVDRWCRSGRSCATSAAPGLDHWLYESKFEGRWEIQSSFHLVSAIVWGTQELMHPIAIFQPSPPVELPAPPSAPKTPCSPGPSPPALRRSDRRPPRHSAAGRPKSAAPPGPGQPGRGPRLQVLQGVPGSELGWYTAKLG